MENSCRTSQGHSTGALNIIIKAQLFVTIVMQYRISVYIAEIFELNHDTIESQSPFPRNFAENSWKTHLGHLLRKANINSSTSEVYDSLFYINMIFSKFEWVILAGKLMSTFASLTLWYVCASIPCKIHLAAIPIILSIFSLISSKKSSSKLFKKILKINLKFSKNLQKFTSLFVPASSMIGRTLAGSIPAAATYNDPFPIYNESEIFPPKMGGVWYRMEYFMISW